MAILLLILSPVLLAVILAVGSRQARAPRARVSAPAREVTAARLRLIARHGPVSRP
ncbi:hypothetical protein [Kitasatospora sp. NPDC057223]|jgi:hypothetical protein|uniref:hypothetical protein n=1 Tax=Kitasatospora sp. NPDC057223 TaxID=3346055 RepID=UPI00362C7899